MLELLTTDAFATWFYALEAAPAEDVAATLEVIVQLGPRKEAPGSSDALLWYEHPSLSDVSGVSCGLGVSPREEQVLRMRFGVDASGASGASGGVFAILRQQMQRVRDAGQAHQMPSEIVTFSRDWGRFVGYAKRVVKHLESPQFVARLARLSPEKAAIVAGAVQRIRLTSTTRHLNLAALQTKRRYFIGQQPTARDLETLAGFLDESEVRSAYFAALAAAGFEVEDVAPQPAALREISLRSTPPGLRLLYGIDESKGRGLVVLGEWLDRSFYGDSVRHAEATWAQFLEGRPLATQPASAR
ncbi:MAG: hypothetical protein ABSC94_24850 [Polyangiaceae bacterium]|jgi:hypothetical protein